MTAPEGESAASIRPSVVALFDLISDVEGFGRVGLPIDLVTNRVLHSRHGKTPG